MREILPQGEEEKTEEVRSLSSRQSPGSPCFSHSLGTQGSLCSWRPSEGQLTSPLEMTAPAFKEPPEQLLLLSLTSRHCQACCSFVPPPLPCFLPSFLPPSHNRLLTSSSLLALSWMPETQMEKTAAAFRGHQGLGTDKGTLSDLSGVVKAPRSWTEEAMPHGAYRWQQTPTTACWGSRIPEGRYPPRCQGLMWTSASGLAVGGDQHLESLFTPSLGRLLAPPLLVLRPSRHVWEAASKGPGCSWEGPDILHVPGKPS